jgi:protein-S-isoprenylcysteine O-methyltransferase Ste14
VTAVADLTLVCWALLEVGVRVSERVRGKGGSDRDRGTRVLIGLAVGAAIFAAVAAASAAPLPIPLGGQVAGVAVIWLGLAMRVAAIAALGGALRTTVEVDPGQAVVATGPYRWIRHPSYAGLLLIVAGFGLTLGDRVAHPRGGSRARPRAGRRLPQLPGHHRPSHPAALVSGHQPAGGMLWPRWNTFSGS